MCNHILFLYKLKKFLVLTFLLSGSKHSYETHKETCEMCCVWRIGNFLLLTKVVSAQISRWRLMINSRQIVDYIQRMSKDSR